MLAPEFDTVRLHLRPLAQRDAGAMFAIMSDPQAMQFWDWPAFTDRDTVEEIVAGQIADMEAGKSLYWAVDAGGVLAGCCDLSEIDNHHGRAEVGFLFGRANWGAGFATEAMTPIMDYAFGPMDLERLWARFHAGNERSRVLLERLGFVREGCLKGHVMRDGKRIDCVLYGRLRS
jgi:[ribosomal protein S5]-alanine N-acetyltransferase